MKSILNSFFEKKIKVKNKEKRVIEISDKLREAMKLSKEDEAFARKNNFYFDVGEFSIIFESRIFNVGWTDTIEIAEKGRNSCGYSNTSNPDWIKVEGTATKNIPPKCVVDYVLNKITEKY